MKEMTLGEAIARSTRLNTEDDDGDDEQNDAAVQLGIEALKQIAQLRRVHEIFPIAELLPGETEEAKQ